MAEYNKWMILSAISIVIIFMIFSSVKNTDIERSSSIGEASKNEQGLTEQAKALEEKPKLEEPKPEEQVKFSECPEGIIPDNIYLEMLAGRLLSYRGTQFRTKWADGVVVPANMGQELLDCAKGSKEGQNINYWYCKNILYDSTKQEVSEDGTILDISKSSYKIDLVLKEENAFNAGSYYIINFSIVDANC